MNKKETEKFKKLLVAESVQLEEELNKLGKKDPSAAGGWDVSTGDLSVDSADDNEMADKFEALEDNAGIADKLEKQLTEVKAALERIDKGIYGVCETCGKSIEVGRLEANPSARISIKHKH